MNKYYKKLDSGNWVHAPRFKVIINPILRKLQFWTDRPYVIATYTAFDTGRPRFLGYAIRRVKRNTQ